MEKIIPVVLFAYARPGHLQQTLAALRADKVPMIYAFSDGPRTRDKEQAVADVRKLLCEIDWCEIVLCERTENLGLGRSILTGVTAVLNKHDAVIVFEDDLICVQGTYQYLTAALRHYQDDAQVMSVTGWTHPRVTPADIADQPYFDGRAECWAWGTWARVWRDMVQDAKTLMEACKARGIDIYRYGADLPAMAEAEQKQNIWAVRFLYLHILNRSLCLRPPYSMVEHIGFDSLATNAGDAEIWKNPPLKPCPPIPKEWPSPKENPQCPRLWQKACGYKPRRRFILARKEITVNLKEGLKLFILPVFINLAKDLMQRRKKEHPRVACYTKYNSWSAALRDSAGYDSEIIFQKKCAAIMGIKRGEAVYERDSVLFDKIQYSWPLVAGLLWIASRNDNRLSLADFGGSLGSTYFQNRDFLSHLKYLSWNIIELKQYVDFGKLHLEDSNLHFYYNLDECIKEQQPDAILLSSVLMYIEEPYALLDKIKKNGFNYILFDRTAFVTATDDILTVQKVPPEIYNANYPCWFFNLDKFLNFFSDSYNIIAEFNGFEQANIESSIFKGFIFERRH